MTSITPRASQPALPLASLLVRGPPGENCVPLDVVFVGAGPAGLSGAIELKRLVKEEQAKNASFADVEVGVLEKAESLGEHSLSGAVVNPSAFHELFKDLKESELPLGRRVDSEAVYLLSETGATRLPTPPTMKNHGNYIGSICEIVRWLGAKAEAAGVNLFTGFPAAALRVENDRVVGVRTAPGGLDRNGQPGANFHPPTDIDAKVTVLSEGTRGMLTQAWLQWQQVGARNPQIYALGVKELWETKVPLDTVIHTLGWPLPRDAFGGSFLYPAGPAAQNHVALGLVVGLDYRDSGLDVHALLQRFKLHPFVRRLLEGGELIEWGAKTIPEGGYLALPKRLHAPGLMICGDGAGLVNVPALKGIHYAIESGRLAAEAAFSALQRGESPGRRGALAGYDEALHKSFVWRDLRQVRNMRPAFGRGFWLGGAMAGAATVSRGAFPPGDKTLEADADQELIRSGRSYPKPDGKLTFDKLSSVFLSGNATRDDAPNHIRVQQRVPPELAELWTRMCPAAVYEVGEEAGDGDVHVEVTPSNCVQCGAITAKGGRLTPPEGGAGPDYKLT